jgi:fructose-1,6-bisphosphatase/inositol monophosphatase family enzyme
VRIDGAPAPGAPPAGLQELMLAGALSCDSEEEARRAGKLHKRLVRRAGGRRALGSAALELAWTAAGRFGACFHEQHLDATAVDAGLFLCQRAGLRVHRLPPLEGGLAPRSSPPASRSRRSCWSCSGRARRSGAAPRSARR